MKSKRKHTPPTGVAPKPFTPSDIIIGQKYINPRHPGTQYIGVGCKSSKHRAMMIAHDPQDSSYNYCLCVEMDGTQDCNEYWAAFKPCDKYYTNVIHHA